MGWSHGDQEVFSVDEMIEHFSLSNISKSASAFNTEKLVWLNQHYMKTLPVQEVTDPLAWHFAQMQINTDQGPALADIVSIQADRVKTLKEMAEISTYFYQDFAEFDANAAKKHLRPVAKEALLLVKDNLLALNEWSSDAIQAAINATAETLAVGMGKVGMPLRVAATGSGNSPSLDVTLVLLEQHVIGERIDKALEFIANRENS